MKLYEINGEIERLLDSIIIDEETGEVVFGDAEEILPRLDELQMERKAVLEYLAKAVLNIRSDRDAISSEVDRLRERGRKLEAREDALLRILDRECGGEKTDLGVASASYRTSEAVVFDNQTDVFQWLDSHERDDCLRRKEIVEIDKAGVRKALKAGEEIPGCRMEVRRNFLLK